MLDRFAQAGIDIDTLANRLQKEMERSLVKSWFDLMEMIASRSAALTQNSYKDAVGGY